MTQEEGLTGDEYKKMTEQTCANCGQERDGHIYYIKDKVYCKKFKAKNHIPEPELLIEGKPATKKEVMKLFDEPEGTQTHKSTTKIMKDGMIQLNESTQTHPTLAGKSKTAEIKTLSDKIDNFNFEKHHNKLLTVEDVKNFIKDLKEQIKLEKVDWNKETIYERIDKLAGKNLI